jgi:alpha-glucosidase
LANHDVDRAATRYGGGAGGVARARAAALIQLSLPGTAYLYNGDELGLENVDLPDDALQDPTWERSGRTQRGRDGERVPVPWSGAAPPFGFSTNPDTWLPMPAAWAALTVEQQRAEPSSTLNLFRTVLQVRRGLPELQLGELEWVDLGAADCLGYRRGDILVALNAGTEDQPLPAGELLVASQPVSGTLPPDTAAWLRVR